MIIRQVRVGTVLSNVKLQHEWFAFPSSPQFFSKIHLLLSLTLWLTISVTKVEFIIKTKCYTFFIWQFPRIQSCNEIFTDIEICTFSFEISLQHWTFKAHFCKQSMMLWVLHSWFIKDTPKIILCLVSLFSNTL